MFEKRWDYCVKIRNYMLEHNIDTENLQSYPNGNGNIFYYYLNELRDDRYFKTEKFFKKYLRDDLRRTQLRLTHGFVSPEEYNDLKTLFNLLYE